MSRYYPPVTVTGNPVNFSAPNGGKLDSVSVQIIPTQDLHGYANPWPAGGGKNAVNPSQFPVTISGSTYVSIPISQAFIQKMKTSGCAMHIDGTLGEDKTRFAIYAWDGTNNEALYIGNSQYLKPENSLTLSGSISSNHLDNVTTIRIYVQPYTGNNKSTINNVYFQVGTDTSVWYPYSNICPISGLTGLSVYVSPTQDPDDATVYNVDWTTQAGTVYGGTVDVVTGVLTVTMAIVDLGTLTWRKGTGHKFYATTTGVVVYKPYTPQMLCDTYKFAGARSASPWYGDENELTCYYVGTGSVRELYINDPAYTDVTEFQTAMSGVQLCYELATPLTYQLTPKQIAALIDQNYIWSSNNETISVVYALLVPGSDKYTLIVNGVDIADFVERDSYRTTLYPVFSEAVQTLDGVGHTALLRKKGELSARFNPRTAADTAIICAALLNAPCEVQYHCLQRNADVTALMTIDSVSALYLSRCLYCRQKWNDIDSITLTEL